MALKITPGTTGTFTVTVQAIDGAGNTTPVVGAVVTATVRDPNYKRLATDQTMTDLGSGLYSLTIDPDWSLTNGIAVVGVFFVDITAIYNGEQLFDRMPYTVAL